jgi:hypothetical protein
MKEGRIVIEFETILLRSYNFKSNEVVVHNYMQWPNQLNVLKLLHVCSTTKKQSHFAMRLSEYENII